MLKVTIKQLIDNYMECARKDVMKQLYSIINTQQNRNLLRDAGFKPYSDTTQSERKWNYLKITYNEDKSKMNYVGSNETYEVVTIGEESAEEAFWRSALHE